MTAVCLALSGVAVLPTMVSAQSDASLDGIIVTGSRIPTDPNLVSSVPIQSLSAENIQNSGEINIADIVADIPALASKLTAEN